MKLRKLKKIVSCLIVSLILTACSSNHMLVEETVTQSVFEYDVQQVESAVTSTSTFSLSDILTELNAQ